MSNTIAFIGERKSGKDFFALHMNQTKKTVRLSFSDEVRRIAHDVFPWLPFDVHPDLKDLPFVHPSNPLNLTPRQIWLQVGQLRNVESKLFVRRFEQFQFNTPLHDKWNNYVITDFRTPDEFEFLKKHNIPIIKIQLADRSGLDDCSFEEYVRNFKDYDGLFVNNMNGTAEFDKFLKDFILNGTSK